MSLLKGRRSRRQHKASTGPSEKPGRRRRLGIMMLEPRIMYDGAAAATVAAAHHVADHPHDHSPYEGRAENPASNLAPAIGAGGPSSDTRSDNRNWDHPNDASGIGHNGMHRGDTVVFVDSQIANYQAIVAAMDPSVRVVVYDGTQDGLHEIAQDLKGVHGLAAIDIISHGAAGEVQLGTDVLTTSNISDHAADLAAIGKALAANGQIDLYGCDVAAAGDGFIDALKAATGRNVAASTDATGAADLGGNWTLEASTGVTASTLPADPGVLAAYHGLLANTLSASQTTTLTGDTDGDGVVDPGETVTTSVTITNNSSTTGATGVTLSETLNGMTQTGSVTVTPIAADDAYTLVGNTPITISAASGVLANDLSPDGGTLTAISLVTSAATHGSVTLNSNGSFTYTPTTGYAGTATFTYIAHDASGLNSNVTGTVTLTVTDPVWYVDSAAAGGGDGSFGHAFQTVAAAFSAAAANGNDPNNAVNDTIFVYNRGSTYSQATGVTLASGEQLLGDGSSLTSVNGNTVGASSSNSAFTVTGNSTTAVTLGSGNTISGINISETGTSGNGIVDSGNVGTLHLIDVGVTTASGTGISLTHGGTVDATGSNTISSTSGVALDVANTTIGASNLTFKSISSGTGADDGIILDTTGSSGGLHVTGDGSTAGSGGTIAGKTGSDGSLTSGIGIYLHSTNDVQLSFMTLQNFQNFGIYGSSVNGFSLNHSAVNTTSGTNGTASGLPFNEGSVYFSELTGTANVTNSTFANGITSDFSVFNNLTGTSLTLNMSGDTFTGASGVTVQELLLQAGLNAGDAPTINANINTSTFTNTDGRGIQAITNSAASMSVNIGLTGVANSGGTFNGMPAAMLDIDHNSTGNYTFNIQNATFTANVSPYATVPINIFNGSASGANSVFQGTISNNTITGGNNSGFDGISMTGSGPGTMTVLVDSNTLTQIAGGAGISYTGAQLSATNHSNLTITNNTVTMTDPNAGFGIMVSAQASSNAHATVEANISNNHVSVSAGPDYRVDSRFSTSLLQMPGYTGGAQDLTAIRNFVAANNSTTSAEVSASTGLAPGGNFGNTPGGAATPLPPALPTLTIPTISGTAQEGQTLTATAATANNGATVTYQWQANHGVGFYNIAGATALTYQATEADDGATLRIVATYADSNGIHTNQTSAATAAVTDHLTLTTPSISGTPQVGQILTASTPTSDNGDATITYQWQRNGANISGATGQTYRATAADIGNTIDVVASAADTHGGSTSATSGATGAVTAAPTFSLPTVNIGTLPANKSVTISWQATIDGQSNQLIVNPANQGTVSATNAAGFPDVNTNTVTTTLDSLTLGNQIYNDANVNSTFDAGDTGIANVALSLFADANNDNVPDGGAIATTTTSAGGVYSFAGLAPGNYIVQVDAGNFTGGGALVSYKSVSPVTASDPDDNVDNDNDGQPKSGGVVLTNSITLAYNTEPTAGTGNDTNNTLDIGFIQNQPPVLDLDSTAGGTGFTNTFTEAGSASAIASVNVTVSDPDDTLLKSATVTITNFQSGQDLLAFTANGSTGDIVAGAFSGGALTLTSAAGATFAQWEAALQAVTYTDSSQNPNTTDRNITVTVDDGEASNHVSNAATATVHITAVNTAPVNTAPVSVVADEDVSFAFTGGNTISISDVDANGGNETVTLTVLNGTLHLGTTAGLSTFTNDAASISLTGALTNVNNALASLSYLGNLNYNGPDTLSILTSDNGNSGVDPSTVGQPATGTASDEQASSMVSINVNAVNDPPVVDLNGAGAGTGVTLNYTENDAATAIAPAGLVTDVDSANFNGGTLTVQFSANGAPEDQLSILTDATVAVSGLGVVSVGGLEVGHVSGGANGAPLQINLDTDDATPAAISTLIAHIGYFNNSDNPSTLARSVSFSVVDGDGGADTGSATATVNIAAVNDAPVATITPPVANYTVGEGSDLNLFNNGLTVSDVDGQNGTETATLTVGEGTLTVTAGGSGANVLNSGTSSVTITGTAAQINALFNSSGTVDYVDNTVIPTTTTITLSIDDGGNTGAGGALTSNLATANIVVTKTDHAPVANDDTYSTSANTPLTIGPPAGVLANDTDADGDTITVSEVNGSAANVGTLIILGSGSTLKVNADGSFTYTPFTGANSDIFLYQTTDGTLFSSTAQVTLNVNPVVPGAPTVTASGNTVSYTELGSAPTIDATLGVVYATNLTNATVAIGTGFFSGDTLNFTDTASIHGVYDNMTGILLLTGSDTAANYQTALESITFSSSSQNPTDFGTDGGRVITFTVTDGVKTSNIGTDTVGIIAVNDAPSAAAPSTHYSTFEQTAVSLKDPALTVSDVDGGGSEIETATLSVDEGILNVTAGTSGASVGNNGTSSVTISGTLTQIDALLSADPNSTISYIDNSDNPIASATLTLTINDNGHTGTGGPLTSSAATAHIDITPVNDPPVLDLDTTVAGTGYTTTFTENGSATIAGPNVLVTDPDNTTLKSATITMTNYLGGEDVLAFSPGAADVGDISLNTNSGGVLTLTSAAGATLVEWQNALQAVIYSNTSDDPDTTDRIVTVTVDDGQSVNHASNTATTTVHVLSVNDPPTLTTMGTTTSYTEDTAAVGLFGGTSVSAIEAGQFIDQLTLTVTNVSDGAAEILNVDGSDVALTDGNSVSTAGNGMTAAVVVSGNTATVTLSKVGGVSAATEATVVDGITYRDASENPTAGDRVITLTSIKDSGGTANGGVDTASLTVASTVSVVPVNDPPVVNLNSATLSYTENDAATAIAPPGVVTDIDSPNFNGGSLTVHFSANGAAEDQLSILTDAAVTVSAGTVSVNGLAVGTVTGGANSNDLVIAFNTDDATQTAISTLIEHIGYANNSDDPSTAARSVSFTLVDGDGGTDTGSDTATINVTAVNDAPVASITQSTYGAQAATSLDLKNTGLSVSDVDGENGSETVTLTVAEGVLNVNAGTSGANVTNSGTASVTIDGTLAQINALLDTDAGSSIDFLDNAPVLTNISLTLRIDDNGNTGGGNQFSIATANIVFDDPPVLSNAGNTISYTELQSPAPNVDSGIIVSDPDAPGSGAQTNSATVTISSAFTGDELRINGNLSGSIGSIAYSFSGNVLSLTGADTMADYQAALQLVTFDSTSLNPTNFGADPARTISWVVKDIDNVASVPVTTTVNITPVNDAAVVSGTVTGAVAEAGGVLNAIPGIPTATGNLTDTDVDNPANTFQVDTNVTSDNGFGTFSMTAGGTWTFTLDNNAAVTQALNNGDVVNETFFVHTVDGTARQITIAITGLNDAAVITGTTAGSVTEAGGADNSIVNTPTASGTLVSTDVDNVNTFQPLTAGAFGIYSLLADGSWTYTLDNNNGAVQALKPGDTITDTITVHSFDGTAQQVSIDIHGANDAPTITAIANLTYNANLHLPVAIDPTLTVTDPDTATLVGATVTIATGQQPEDVLTFVNQNGITENFDPLTGVLTLTGSASVANYQAALESVTFTSSTLKSGHRTITWTADDGGANGVSSAATTDMLVQGLTLYNGPNGNPGAPAAGPGFTPTENPTDTGLTTVGFGGGGNDFVGDGIAAVYFVTADVATSTDATGLFQARVRLIDLEAPLNGDVSSIFAAQADGEPLPDWLHFDPSTGIFTGRIPPDAKGILTVQVIVRDSAGHESVMQIKFDLSKGKAGWNLPTDRGFGHDPWAPDQSAQPRRHAAADLDRDVAILVGHTILPRDGQYDGPALAADRTMPVGRSGLSDQLKAAGWHGMNAQRMALLESLRQSAMSPH